MVDRSLDRVEKFGKQKIAANYETSSALSSFAMDSYDRVFQEIVMDDLELLLVKFILAFEPL